jgi:hypothetical protein
VRRNGAAQLTRPRPCCCAQVRPNDNVQWRKLTIQEAYAACLTTDKLVEAVTAVARGATTEAAAAAELAAFSVPEVRTARALASRCRLCQGGHLQHAPICRPVAGLLLRPSR